jgi:hypothetical protein
VRISKKHLQRIINEEKTKLLEEQWGSEVETGSDLIDFAKAYAGLGNAVQEQVDRVIASYFSGGGPDSAQFEDTVYEQNPNAIRMAIDRLVRPGRNLGGEAEDILNALDVAMELFEQGEPE